MAVSPQTILLAVDAALNEPNQIAFHGAPLRAVTVPCCGRTDLTAAALMRIAERVKQTRPHGVPLVDNAQALTHQLGLGMTMATRQQGIVHDAAAQAVAAIAAWASQYGQPRRFSKPLHLMRQLYGLADAPPQLGPQPRPLEHDERLALAGRYNAFLGRPPGQE